MAFLAGLSTWHGTALPTEGALKGHTTLEQGVVHIKCILNSGGTILGLRPLALDGIEPTLFLSQAASIGGNVQRGFLPVRASTLTDRGLPVFSHWGYDVIVALARKHFAEGAHGA
jgi:hypothetical protein